MKKLAKKSVAPFIFSGAALAIAALQLLFHFLPYILADGPKGQSLSGPWQTCWKKDSIQACEWVEKKFPSGQKSNRRENDVSLVLRKNFHDRLECRSKQTACTLLLGTVSDPAHFYLNGKWIGKVGNPQVEKSYAQLFPVSLPLPLEYVQDQNLIEIEIFPNYLGSHGLIRGPISVVESTAVDWLKYTIVAQTVFLPLLSAVILFLIVVCAAQFFSGYQSIHRHLLGLSWFALAMALYLFSLTRIPRAFINPELGAGLHFSFRLVVEILHVRLLERCLGTENRFTKILKICFAFVFIALFGLTVTQQFGVAVSPFLLSNMRVVFKYTVLSFIIVPMLWILFWAKTREINRKKLNVLALVYALLSCMIVSDFMALNGWLEDIYFVRFYPVLLVFAYVHFIWIESSAERSQREAALEIAGLAAQLSHDLKSPLAALKTVGQEIEFKSDSQKKIFDLVVRRMGEIIEKLLAKRREIAEKTSNSSHPAQPYNAANSTHET